VINKELKAMSKEKVPKVDSGVYPFFERESAFHPDK